MHKWISAKCTIVASILQDDTKDKDSYKAGAYTVCKPSGLKKYLKETNHSDGSFEKQSKCDFQIMDAQEK